MDDHSNSLIPLRHSAAHIMAQAVMEILPGTKLGFGPAIDDGFYVMLKPLSVGPHTLHFMGASAGCPLIGSPFSVDVTYDLTIVPVSLK